MVINKNKRKMPFHRRKICRFCADSSLVIDYKDVKSLRFFTTERGAKHQRILTIAIERARKIALLPYTTSVIK
jgi:small subunit ribosomal protein S18